MYDVYLSLGSNMGDRERNISEAVRQIGTLKETKIGKLSSIYETEPVGYICQDRFLNAALLVRTGLRPDQLLFELQEIENRMKRVRTIRWGPRTIDIDILLYDNIRIDTPQLTVPHPRMTERAFVLIPLKEIFEGSIIQGMEIDELIDRCDDKNGIRLYGR